MAFSIDDLIRREVQRYMTNKHHERHGLVTSYDPENHLAKIMLQPEGVETTWVPIETNHIGNGYGIAIGLTPGDGKKTGDQVIVRFQEGDMESGKVVKVVHSDKDKPPTVQSGEMVFWTVTKDQQGNVTGQQRMFFTQQGQIKHEILDQQGNNLSSIVMDQSSITHNSTELTHNASDTFSVNSSVQSLYNTDHFETIGPGLSLIQKPEKNDKKPPFMITTQGPHKKSWGKA